MVERIQMKKKAPDKPITKTSRKMGPRYRPEFSDEVRELCKLGATDRDLALHFNVTTATIRNWRDKHEAFFIEVLQGKQEADVKVAGSLYKNANGFYYYEEQLVKKWNKEYDSAGVVTHAYEVIETVNVKKYCKPDTTAQIFWLKNRRPHDWRDAHLINLEQDENNKKIYKGQEVTQEFKKRGLVVLEAEFTVVKDASAVAVR